MFSLRVLASVAGAVLLSAPPASLQVLSFSPGPDAPLTAPVQVIFDRPVAGSLDRSVDATAIFRIEPAVPGRVEWRDPVTLRFKPESTLDPGQTYTVTIANSFEAMDGSRLQDPFTYSFTVTGPALLAGLPVSAGEHPRYLAPDATFELVYSAPLAPAWLRGLAYLDLDPTCPAPGIIRLTVTEQRPIRDKDPWQYREAGGWQRDRTTDPLRRVLVLSPERKLPLNCRGELVAPQAIDPEGTKPFVRWAFSTYGPLHLIQAVCAGGDVCPTGGVRLRFSTPVKGGEIARRVSLLPAVAFTVSDTSEESDNWYLEAQLTPRTGYAVMADTALRDVFGQPLEGNPVAGFRTTGFAPLVEHEYGRLTVERDGFGTLAVKYINVDTLSVTIAPVPASLIPAVLQYSRWSRNDSLIAQLLKGAATTRVAVQGPRDQVRIYGVKIPLYNMARPSAPLMQLVRVTSPALPLEWQQRQPFAVVQVTDLAVHARIGVSSGAVWVTGVHDGLRRGGVQVTLFDTRGKSQASSRTAPDGTAILGDYRADTTALHGGGFEGYVVVSSGNDEAITAISAYDPDLSPWQFNIRSGYGPERVAAAAAVFTERGIYRPGEPLYAKAIVRTGTLGALAVPARSDSVRWVFQDRERATLKEVTVAPSPFGTTDQTITLPADLKLGTYGVEVQQRRAGEWLTLASTSYRVAEYRPPEFLVDATTDTAPRFPGDTIEASVEARYLFGAPMGRAALTWSARQVSLNFWEFEIPNTDGFFFGDNGWWWEENAEGNATQALAQGNDTLDDRGRAVIRFAPGSTVKGRPARATFIASVSDVNRQAVAAQASVLIHSSSFYIGAKPLGRSYFWTAGQPGTVGVIAVRPDGHRVPGVSVRGTVVRQEWHRVHRTRGGYSEVYGEWVPDTVAHCALVTASDSAVPCSFTPSGGGTYVLSFEATDEAGRPATTSLYRWATGKNFVPWNDESQFKMDVVPDKTRYNVGDTATVLFAAPFTDAEAWVTVEREGLIEQRRLRLTSGATTLKFPVTESWAPNVFVSVLVARGRSARPGPLDDPGRPTIRVGYTEVRVTPEVKRLTVAIRPLLAEYRPGDTVNVELRVTDRAARGQRSEVTLWAVDEGVLSLTGYRTPDPLDLLYAPRGLGLRLASNLTSVAPQVPEGEKGGRAPGGGGGQGESDILRSRFQTTAFFLGSILTDASGSALAKAKLPDNLTTFRVMAVAVTAGDRYGSAQSPLLVTRPLLARPALPRFIREGDRFLAGVVVNQRAGGTPTVKVSAEARGARIASDTTRTAVLLAGRGREVRFEFQRLGNAPLGDADSASFRFRVSGSGDADLVEKRLAVKPAFHPRAWTVSGVLVDTANVEIVVPEGLDPDRSRLELTVGSSPLSVIKGLSYALEVYPYYCSEQVSSVAQGIIALYRAQQQLKGITLIPGNPRAEIEAAVAILSRRQRGDGSIGYWGPGDWSTPWLSAYAGLTLLDARNAGVTVSDSVLSRLAQYLHGALSRPQPIRAPVIGWYDSLSVRLGDQVAAADFLSRLGTPDIPAENELLRNAPQLAWEDRLRLAELLARRKAMNAARTLLEPAWAETRIEGRRATVPEVAFRYRHYFSSRVRPIGWLLTATLAVDSSNALIGPLVETLTEQGRAGGLQWWNTQDYAAVVEALAAFDRRTRAGLERPFTLQGGGRTLMTSPGVPVTAEKLSLHDSSVALTGLVRAAGNGKSAVQVALAAKGAGAPIYYYLTVHEVPTVRPVNPENQGIQVERWYEKYERPEPVTGAVEGALVRVRLRVTVSTDRPFVIVDDALPAGLEAVDLSLRTASLTPGPGVALSTNEHADDAAEEREGAPGEGPDLWFYGSWDSGWWSPFDHKEMRDDRVVYSATLLWKGTYSMTYLARATTPGTFIRPPAHAEEMYNPAVYGRSDGGVFTVTEK